MNARRRRWWFLGVLFLGLAGMSTGMSTATVQASEDDMAVWRSAQLLEEISSDPKPGIPQDELRRAVGILIAPRIVEVRIGLGRKSGHGVLLTRDEKGEWGHPEPVDVSGLSLGAEAAHEVTDMVVLFHTPKAIEQYGKNPGRFTIFMGATLAMHGRGFHPHPTSAEKDYHVYVRHHGFFVGAGMIAETKRSPAFKAEPEPEPKPAATTASTATKGAKSTAAAAPTTAKAARKPAEHKPDPRTARHARADEARIRRLAAAPSMPRLKATLTALTTRPAQAQVAATGTTTRRDAAVRPAAGSRPAGPSAATVPTPSTTRPSIPPPSPVSPAPPR